MGWFTRLLVFMFVVGLVGWLFGVWSFTKILLAMGLVVLLRVVAEAGFFAIGLALAFNLEVNDLALLKERLYNRLPLIGGWLRRKTVKALSQLLQQGSCEVAGMLAEALTQSDDKKVRRIAGAALEQITSQPCIDAVTAVWVETRHLGLTKLLVEHRWVASEPVNARIFSALKADQLEFLTGGDAAVVEGLVAACEDFDEDIAGRSRQVLRQLEREDAREALCRAVIEHEHPLALEIALETGYLPREASERALFLFLTEQWERYEDLDFDYYLLRSAHRAASAELRRRITSKLRKAGRIDFLTVLTGTDYHSHAADMTLEETEVLVETLTAAQEWPKLWKLVFELPFVWGIRIIQTLHKPAWQPEQEEERMIFGELRALADAEIVTSEEEARKVLPVALHEATIRVKGRVNDVAFSPVRPVIAIGTGNRKVGLWNFQHAEMEQIFGGFGHSIGLVTFLPDGTLICAERTNKLDDPCKIYFCRQNKTTRLGQHEGSVTAIEVVNETQILSTGRDRKVVLWDVKKKRKIKEESLSFWARAAKVAPDAQHVALLYEGVALFNLPKLERVMNWTREGVGRCAAFIPDESVLLVGKHNGNVQIYDYANYMYPTQRQFLTRHTGRAEGVALLPHNPIIITAGSEGKLNFTNWTDRKLFGNRELPKATFTALHLSPDGAFMSTGDSDASMSLWDLRVLHIPRLFTRPFAHTSPDHLATINELAANPQLEKNVQRSLTFIRKVLQYRFRFDIEIAEVPKIKAGEFDIEIE